MAENKQQPAEERAWLRYPHRNNNSLAMTIPAGIRQKLNWHMNAPLVVTLEGDHMKVRQMDVLKAPAGDLPAGKFKRRKKSWKRGPQEEKSKSGGLITVRPTPDPDES